MTDSDCIFCRIVAGEIPCAKVFEDEHCLAFLDVSPLAVGHTLLIPKGHWETIDAVPPDIAGGMLKNLPAISAAVQKVVACSGFNVLQNNGRCAHQEVMHVHFHIIPRNDGDAFGFNWPAGSCEADEANNLAEKIKKYL